MDIRMLDIDQCPDKYHVPNAYKDTHKCDDKSSYVRKASYNLLAPYVDQSLIFLYSVCQFWAEASRQEVTSANVNRVTSIRLKIPSLISTVN